MDFQNEEAQRIRSKSQWKRSGREERGRRSGSGARSKSKVFRSISSRALTPLAGDGAVEQRRMGPQLKRITIASPPETTAAHAQGPLLVPAEKRNKLGGGARPVAKVAGGRRCFALGPTLGSIPSRLTLWCLV